jgi:hypothetical protein
MSHFAKVIDGIVSQVIVAEQDVIDSGMFGNGWIQTSYNTHGNRHHAVNNYTYDSENNAFSLGGTPLRGNYAANGYTYDSINDVFYAPKPYSSWVLNQSTWLWEAPIPCPADGKKYVWNETTTSWLLVE